MAASLNTRANISGRSSLPLVASLPRCTPSAGQFSASAVEGDGNLQRALLLPEPQVPVESLQPPGAKGDSKVICLSCFCLHLLPAGVQEREPHKQFCVYNTGAVRV